MSTYPTPPPTSSPKYSQSQQEMPSQPESRPYRPMTPERKESAQNSYWKDDYSAPSSPKHWDNGSRPLPPQVNGTGFQPPPRRQSSPIRIQTTQFRPLGGVQYGYDSAAEQIPYYPPPPAQAAAIPPPPPLPVEERRKSKSSRPASPRAVSPRAASPRAASTRSRAGSPRSPKPIYFSPTNPMPSPYSASRPQPRPGFLRRMLDKFREWISSLMEWASNNPIKAGIFSFLPVIAAAGFVKGASKIGGAVGKLFGIKSFGFKGLGNIGKGWNSAEGKWQYGLDEFVGFAGSKAGPIDGAMKIIHMLM